MLRKVFFATLVVILASGLLTQAQGHGRKFHRRHHRVALSYSPHPVGVSHGALRIPPPAPRPEAIPPRPVRWAVWIPGHWVWNYGAGCWVWSPGYWHRRPRGVAWIPGHWQDRTGVWIWIEGHWRP